MNPAQSSWSAFPLPKRSGPRDDLPFGDENGEPESAIEYLLRVRAEAERLPQIVVAEVSKYENCVTEWVDLDASAEAVDIAPDWQRSLLADFSDVRLRMAVNAAKGVGATREMSLPRMKDTSSWHAFCFGKKPAEPPPVNDEAEPPDNLASPPPRDDEDFAAEDEVIRAFDGSAVLITKEGHVPSMRLVLQFDGILTQALLAMHVGWLEAHPVCPRRAQWLYSLLARLEQPLGCDGLATVRQLVVLLLRNRRTYLLEKGAQKRSFEQGITDAEGTKVAADILLVLAGKYFNQARPDELR
ncbi:survival motor neuron interacting protein 1-domain-containing protein [Pelagophyceae sp. CCMP2097]|nr:survival motor neuron interacting protein 1-domain-containing protein [Pelagophyceae sp. CCMP2097]|mmetsp:Transcript_25263/g.84911  ORF Transcript_25263/g.84911 Transcript_25263/m.84911 type:complete len:299 (-) Transcript_25263:67-963(-)